MLPPHASKLLKPQKLIVKHSEHFIIISFGLSIIFGSLSTSHPLSFPPLVDFQLLKPFPPAGFHFLVWRHSSIKMVVYVCLKSDLKNDPARPSFCCFLSQETLFHAVCLLPGVFDGCWRHLLGIHPADVANTH